MTLKHFKINFPDVYKQYATSTYAIQKHKSVLFRIRAFLSTKGVEIMLTPNQDESYYYPTIKFTDHKPQNHFKAHKFKSMNEALTFGLESAIAYLETGFYN